MKKIIVAFDGLRFSESAMQYAFYFARRCNAQIVGVFLNESTKLGYAVYEAMVKQSVSGKDIVKEIDKTDADTISHAIDTFESGCREAKLDYIIHRDKANALKELLHETVFADLLIIDAWETFSYIEGNLPGWFIKNVLHDAHCPVIVVPKKFKPVNRLVLLYDGSPSSMHAIKMLNYILPEMKDMEAKLVHVGDETSSLQLPGDELLKEWMKKHYAKVLYNLLKGYENEIPTILANEDKDILVVAGAYHRSNMSMRFHKSLADLLMRAVDAPIFIAHT